MLLSSVLITSDGGGEAPELPPRIAENIESLKRLHPGLPHRLWLEGDVLDLIETSFGGEVRDAYLALKPFAYRADLARYCILHQHGGLYADLSYFFVGAVPMPEDQMVVFRGNLFSAPWDTSNAVIYAPPGHKALQQAIDLVCRNVKRRYYGPNGLCPTGPALFGKALAMACDPEELQTGRAALWHRDRLLALAPQLPPPDGENVNCMFLKRTMIAFNRKRLLSKGLAELGITTGNAYRDLWNEGDVYAE